MSALFAPRVLDALLDAGLTVSITPELGVKVVLASNLTTDLRELIRSSKAMLIDWLTAANDAVDHAPDAPDNPMDWHELDAAYLAHHVNCKVCIAAGRGVQYGLRCGAGPRCGRCTQSQSSHPPCNIVFATDSPASKPGRKVGILHRSAVAS